MFLPHNQTLLTNLATAGTLVLKKADGSPQDFDEYRMSPFAHVLMVDDVRYTAPTDFTLASDGTGDITLTWLNVTTLVTGKVLRIGVAYIDLIVAGSTGAAGGGGSTDMTATNALLTQIKDGLASTIPSATFGAMKWSDITFTADTGALAAGEVIADTQLQADVFPVSDQPGVCIHAVFHDEDDQTWATTNGVRLIFYRVNRSLGTENASPSISDANARDIVGSFTITPDNSDYYDLGGVKIAQRAGTLTGLTPVDDTDDIYVALQNLTGTPTYAGGAPRCSILIGQ